MMFDTQTYHGQTGTPWLGQPLNGVLTASPLQPLAAACLAAQNAFVSVLGQYLQPAIGGWQQPLAGALGLGLGFSPFGHGQPQFGYGQPQQIPFGGIPGPYAQPGMGWPIQSPFVPQQLGGHQPIGWPGHQPLGGGAFGQRGGFGSQLPFQAVPQMAYAG
jgi:hypothetical protein